MTRVVARKVLKNITREIMPSMGSIPRRSIKLVTGEVVPATANLEYFLSVFKVAFYRKHRHGTKILSKYWPRPASVFVFEPSICVNQWTEDIDVAANTYNLEEMPQSVEEAMISSQKVLLIQSMTTNDDYILDRLFRSSTSITRPLVAMVRHFNQCLHNSNVVSLNDSLMTLFVRNITVS